MTDERVSMDGDSVDAGTVSPAPARRRSLLPLLILTLLAFALGVGLTVWAWPQIQSRWGRTQSQKTATPTPRASLPAATPRPLSNDSAQMLDGRVVQLEERLTRITVEAQAASANAARAEGLLVAFAARRALDNGGPLGYIEGQLRLRFGQAQPRAVATIINAAREPVTLADLRAGLANIGDALVKPPASASWWDALEHEARELVTIRKADAPSPRPEAAYDRAMRYLDGGRVSAALAQVEHMPGRAVAEKWVQMARRYMEARRALDLIETAAILEPRTLRSSEGAPVAQTSPLAP
ncbi:hypothetical protein NYF14_16520 [Sphingobium sp. 10 DY56-G10]|uniref:hypothetical protein n=1 Tax=Sphingomonadales TaxID=204457 RepID=UPI0000D7AE0E|nr:hypothetical protein [Sphingomonas sp. SKA58]EAT07515.1 hypothetical protein SKA58_02904 [Sphingomonas sp. SKA58]